MSIGIIVVLFLSVSFWYTQAIQYEILPYNPKADTKAVVVLGNARFTVLTPRLIRIEYGIGRFEDRATVAIVNRLLPVPPFTQVINGGILTITTAALQLTYTIGQPFSSSTLSIVSRDPSSVFTRWSFGQADTGNLLGTIKSLDELNLISLNCTVNSNVIVHDEKLHCEWGLISRNGWAVVDDQTNWGLEDRFWWSSPNVDQVDQYFFGHGHDYKGALSDFVLVGGRIAMTPRYASGIWWSRWLNINNIDVRAIVEEYETRDIPLDIYILDMDWHQKYGWGGYTVDSHLFPYPQNTFGWLSYKGLYVGANLHDDDGIHPYENKYNAFCNAVGVNPTEGKPIPFSATNATYMFALEDIVLRDVEDMGMNFWWIDWQQGGTHGGCQGDKQNPTYLLNHVRSTDNVRRGSINRGLVLGRWGGLGTHRYQVGFSGDVADLSWSNLAFQPYFTMTASNVGYGFWSHDLVGPSSDHELHTRWLQWGAYSGVFRTHDRGMSQGDCADTPAGCPRVEVWNVPDPYFSANREAMLHRSRLIPYIYTQVRKAYDTGVSIIRPMYYEYPKFDIAYAADQNGNFGQYFFGDDIFVAPITSAGLKNNSLAFSKIWIPPGVWFETETGVLHKGDDAGTTILSKYWDISEVPVFVRAGAIIPKIPIRAGDTTGIAQRQYTTLVLTIYPGATSGTTDIYEDDGKTTNYIADKFVWTTVTYSRTNTDFKLTISLPKGSYPEFPITRNYIIEIVNSLPITSASVNGINIPYSRWDTPNTWNYDGPRLTTVIETAYFPTTTDITIIATTNPIEDAVLSGIKGSFQKSVLAKRTLDITGSTPGSNNNQPAYLNRAASTGESLTYLAGLNSSAFSQVLTSFPLLFGQAVSEVLALKPSPYALVQLWDADRQDNCLCGTPDCFNANGYYQRLRIEGYQPKAGTPGTVPLNDFWNANIMDNYATTQSGTPSGYTPANFGDGLVFSKQEKGTVPLRLFWSAKRNDMLTVASPEGVAYAKQNDYQEVNSNLGYVLTDPPEEPDNLGLSLTRWAHAIDLLYNAVN